MKIKKDIAISETGFIFNPSTGESFSVNFIGAHIITQMKDGKTYEEIKADVLENYQTDEDTFEKDYYDYLSLLKGYGLLEGEEK
jgi:hypothetical protein